MPLSNPALAAELLTAILESAAQGILISTPEGTITFANQAASDIFGYATGELVGKPVECLLPSSDTDVHRRYRDQYFTKPQTRPMGHGRELEGMSSDGTAVQVEIRLTSVSFNETTYAIAFVTDIRERLIMQSQLVAAQRMEAMGQIASGVAHDFNNMLTAIMGNNELALQHTPLPDPSRRYLELISVACERAKSLVRQIIDFGSQQVIQLATVDLNDVVEGMTSLLQGTVGEHIHIVEALSTSVPAVRADRSQVEQVILNLAVNARDAMPKGGNLTIETRVAEIDANYVQGHFGAKEGRYVQLSISDTGHGMSDAVKARAMEPFFTTKGPGIGTGLGLSIVYGIVQRHHGDIWIYSERDHGTTVKIYWPLDKDRCPGASIGQSKGEAILVVEDEEMVRDVIERMLRDSGYIVYSVADADQAIRFSRRHSGVIDVVLTDMRLPRGTGTEVAAALVKHRPGISVIFTSGNFDDTSPECNPAPFRAELLEKPFTATELDSVIRRVLKRSG